MHHPHHPPAERFASDLNYKWVQYTRRDMAADLFWENFDDRAAEQEAAYKIDQQAAKKAGKRKTRRFRHLDLHRKPAQPAPPPSPAPSAALYNSLSKVRPDHFSFSQLRVGLTCPQSQSSF